MSSSGDPGYKMTSRMACESALCLALVDPSVLPGGKDFGGFLTFLEPRQHLDGSFHPVHGPSGAGAAFS